MWSKDREVWSLPQLSARAVRSVARRSFRLAKAHYNWSLPDPTTSNPVIIYSVGKVGSSSVAATLEATLKGRSVAHVHWLRAEHLRADEAHYRSRARAYRGSRRVARLLPRYVWLGQRLSDAISAAPPGAVWDVVTLVRDPVSRNVSSFFQNLEPLFDVWPAEELKFRSAEDFAGQLVELFLDSYIAGNSPVEHDPDPLTWFDVELKPVFGIDVYANPFPASRGYEIYTGSNSRVLLMRLENLDRVAKAAVAEFFGTEVPDMVQRNEAADKVYADVYRRFKKLLRMPREYLDRMYSSPYSQHFYTPAELAEFRARWE